MKLRALLVLFYHRKSAHFNDIKALLVYAPTKRNHEWALKCEYIVSLGNQSPCSKQAVYFSCRTIEYLQSEVQASGSGYERRGQRSSSPLVY